ncbi:MAG TPA: alanine--tRNA ligase [Planctomycetaceae bacterium]|nr:alanine--tRNA ligase [Planctomycetaceae bacterium]
MKTDELREKYLSFFESQGCVKRPSDVLVPKDDPTVLFTPAGMNQFKNQFLGIGELEFTKATTCQKCLRTGDISNVGVTAYHHTFFEMLGNFSFGNYFKLEAIQWAWEFLTGKKWLGINPEQLSVTVYKDDDEAYDIWNKKVGLPANRISREEEDENFWPASAPSLGPDGVCGPCSEIYFHPKGSDKVEIWNLVFTQFNRVGDPPDNLKPLPKKNIDTGMGLERTASVLQGKVSNFEIDTLRKLCGAAAETVGMKYKFSDPAGRAVRRIADHMRAVTFCIHEGVEPGNEKQNYIVRQLLRRAMLEGYLLGRNQPFLYQLVQPVIEIMARPYPELKETRTAVEDSIREEENQFLHIIERGVDKFERIVEKTKSSGAKSISGEAAFDLHQTDGFLIELCEAMAARSGLMVDREGFQKCVEKHKKDSGTGAFADSVMSEGPLDALKTKTGTVKFLGYDTTEAECEIVGIIANHALQDSVTSSKLGEDPIAIVLKETPFYGEAGGQVGDKGTLKAKNFEFTVEDTQKDGELILHLGRLTSGTISVGDTAQANVTSDRRAGIRRAHSATHVLHHALHVTLGKDAVQRGSKVEQDQLRFDFSHKSAVTPEELVQIEEEINRCIALGADVTTEMMALDDARKLGAMALFGEKYPDRVRVVRMGDFSTELCGGTHLFNTGQVGFCKIISEEPVAKGVRRITAVTGPKAVGLVREQEGILKQLLQSVKANKIEDLPARIATLQEELKSLRKELTQAQSQSAAEEIDQLVANAESIGETKIIVHQIPPMDKDAVREFLDKLRGKSKSAAILIVREADGKVALNAAVSKDLLDKGVTASECVKLAAKVVGGGGGGRPDMAEAGGRFPEKIDEALAAGMEYYKSNLSA